MLFNDVNVAQCLHCQVTLFSKSSMIISVHIWYVPLQTSCHSLLSWRFFILYFPSHLLTFFTFLFSQKVGAILYLMSLSLPLRAASQISQLSYNPTLSTLPKSLFLGLWLLVKDTVSIVPQSHERGPSVFYHKM